MLAWSLIFGSVSRFEIDHANLQLFGQFKIKDVGVIANLWLCEPSLKIDHANPPYFVGC